MLCKKKRIDFIIIGAQKAGTSALHKYLANHENVYMPDKKELHFFDRKKSRRFSSKYRDYHRHFDFSTDRIKGEATPIYIYWQDSLTRIKSYNPKIKLILILRNPIDRAFSHWNMEYRRGNERRLFLDCIKQEIEELNQGIYQQHKVKSYVDRGLYYKQIKRLMTMFPKENIYIDFYFNLKRDEKAFVENILLFLNLGISNYKFEKKIENVIEYDKKISLEEKKLLMDFYHKDIQMTEKILEKDLKAWYK